MAVKVFFQTIYITILIIGSALLWVQLLEGSIKLSN